MSTTTKIVLAASSLAAIVIACVTVLAVTFINARSEPAPLTEGKNLSAEQLAEKYPVLRDANTVRIGAQAMCMKLQESGLSGMDSLVESWDNNGMGDYDAFVAWLYYSTENQCPDQEQTVIEWVREGNA